MKYSCLPETAPILTSGIPLVITEPILTARAIIVASAVVILGASPLGSTPGAVTPHILVSTLAPLVTPHISPSLSLLSLRLLLPGAGCPPGCGSTAEFLLSSTVHVGTAPELVGATTGSTPGAAHGSTTVHTATGPAERHTTGWAHGSTTHVWASTHHSAWVESTSSEM